jgi:hypothetical protein
MHTVLAPKLLNFWHLTQIINYGQNTESNYTAPSSETYKNEICIHTSYVHHWVTRNKYDTTNITEWLLTNSSATNELTYSIYTPSTTTCTVYTELQIWLKEVNTVRNILNMARNRDLTVLTSHPHLLDVYNPCDLNYFVSSVYFSNCGITI